MAVTRNGINMSWELHLTGPVDQSMLGEATFVSLGAAEIIAVGRWTQDEVVELVGKIIKNGAEVESLRQLR